MSGRFAWNAGIGATMHEDGSVTFRLWAPSAPAVALLLEDDPPRPMAREADGYASITVAAHPGARYRYRLDNGTAVPDPASRAQEDDIASPSLVVDPRAYAWRLPEWRGRPWHEAVITEIHAGTAGGFTAIRRQLPRLAALGITTLELMPVAEFPGARNWGYDGVLPYAPESSYGTPEELKALVDAAHGFGLNIMLDVVYNHFGPDGNWLHDYAAPFFRDDLHTPWGAAIDFRQRPVRDYFIQNALMWLMEYRFDGLRFDAVHAIQDPDFLIDMAATIRATIEPGRNIALVLEHEDNKASLLEGAYDAQWADDWHHCLHVLLTGENEGYYEDFQDATRLLARCLEQGFAYQGEVSPHRGAPRGEPSGHLPPTAFVTCLQNHDQIGNRAFGERLTALAQPEALRAARALLLLSPFIPMLFMGEEWGTRRPFLFFTSHNDELARNVREGRREEFRHFAAFTDEAVRETIPDPNDFATFAESIPPLDEAEEPEHAAILAETTSLLAIRAAHVTPHIPGTRSAGADILGDRSVLARWRLGNGALLTIAINLARAPVNLPPLEGTTLYETPAAAAQAARLGRLPALAAIALLGPAS